MLCRAVLDQLLDARERPLLDRLRIVSVKSHTSADEEKLIQAMLAEDVEGV
jgi:hypothetical protein